MTVFGAKCNANCRAERQTAKRVSLYSGVFTLFNWGIIGTGFVARKFVLSLRASAGGRALAVASRSAASANAFATDFGITSHGDDLAALLASGVDAIYIATPPTAHREQALAAIAAGKPILVEKPFAASLADAQDIAAAAAAAGVFAMEGVWTLFLPLVAEIRSLLAAGAIGEIRSLEASFGLSNIPEASDNQFNASLGGGALLHRGLYPLALATGLLGPARLAGSAATIGATGVDEDSTLVLRHDTGAIATLRASLRAPLANDLRIEGTHGFIHIEAPIYRPFTARIGTTSPARRSGGRIRFEALRESSLAQAVQQRLNAIRSGGRTLTRHFTGNGYHYEADAVMRAVQGGARQSDVMPLADSLAIAALIDEARQSWKL